MIACIKFEGTDAASSINITLKHHVVWQLQNVRAGVFILVIILKIYKPKTNITVKAHVTDYDAYLP